MFEYDGHDTDMTRKLVEMRVQLLKRAFRNQSWNEFVLVVMITGPDELLVWQIANLQKLASPEERIERPFSRALRRHGK